MRLGIRTRFAIIGATAALAAALIIGTAWWAVSRVRVGGPIYQDIVNGKDLIADVLPPPAYIIESYLVCLQMLGAERDELDALEARALQLEADFRTRQEFWHGILPEDARRAWRRRSRSRPPPPTRSGMAPRPRPARAAASPER
jgi:methyl-accepting chemotaxis protein